jgi:hypothetical protein
LVLFQSQQYRILVEDAYGFRNSPIPYQLTAKPDAFPTVDLLRPAEDGEINGDEVLVVEYGARDDFGIAEVNLIAKIGDREEKIRLLRDENRRVILREEFKWDLGKLALRDGDEVLFHLEVWDNDTVSGPKRGTSRAIRFQAPRWALASVLPIRTASRTSASTPPTATNAIPVIGASSGGDHLRVWSAVALHASAQ